MASRELSPSITAVTSGQQNPRREDTLASIAREVRVASTAHGELDPSERDAMAELADRAEELFERLQAIIDWADFALRNPQEFDSHGVRNLDGPAFDAAREALAKAEGSHPSSAEQVAGESSRDTHEPNPPTPTGTDQEHG